VIYDERIYWLASAGLNPSRFPIVVSPFAKGAILADPIGHRSCRPEIHRSEQLAVASPLNALAARKTPGRRPGSIYRRDLISPRGRFSMILFLMIIRPAECRRFDFAPRGAPANRRRRYITLRMNYSGYRVAPHRSLPSPLSPLSSSSLSLSAALSRCEE